MSQHDNNNADGPICNDSGREAHADSLEEGIVGRAVAINTPGATHHQEEGWEKEKDDRKRRRDDRDRKKITTRTKQKDEQRVRRGGRHMGTSQVPRPTLMSCHYPVNTATHVVSDQLGRHKGRGLELSWGLIVCWSHLGHSLPLRLFTSFLFVGSGREARPTRESGSVEEGGGNFIRHLAKDVKQRLQLTRPSLDLASSSLCSSAANTHTHTHTKRNTHTHTLKT